MKVMTIVGTRPEVIKLSEVVRRLDEHVEHVFVHTGQNYDYELNEIFFEGLGLRQPDRYLDVAGGTLAETFAAVITRSDEVIAEEKPDAILVLGDTNSALSVLSAKRRQVPIFHMEAGNRCFDQRVPEEINRKIVDHISDINLTYTEHARRYLLAEGLPPDRVIKTGSPQYEVLQRQAASIDASDVLDRLGLQAGGFFTASLHREENVDDPDRLALLVDALNSIASEHDSPVVLSTHPRARARLDAAGLSFDERVRDLAPLGLADYVALMRSATCTLSDSGTITEESAMVGFPAVTLREAHERPEGMDHGVLVMSGIDSGSVLASIDAAVAHFGSTGPPSLPADYAVADVSWRILKLILSYTDFVNRVVWHR